MLRFSALFCARTWPASATPSAASPVTDFMKRFLMILSSGSIFLYGLVLFSSRRAACLAPARRGDPARELPRNVADRLDFEPAVHRGAPGLDARPRGQRVAAGEIRAVDPVELL